VHEAQLYDLIKEVNARHGSKRNALTYRSQEVERAPRDGEH
jgi:hypothetical protein